MKIFFYLINFLVIILFGCTAPKPGTPEFVQKKDEELQKSVVQAVEQNILKAPIWYTQPPVNNNSIFQTATEVSPDMQRSMDRAVSTAKALLASRLGDRVSQKINEFVSEAGSNNDETLNRVIETTRKSVALDVNVAGFVIEKSLVVQENNRYRSYVLISYSLNENNKVIANQIKQNSLIFDKLKASKAFDDLEKEIESAKK